MSRISLIALQNSKREKQEARECLALGGYDARACLRDAGIDEILHSVTPQELDRILKRRCDLTFEQAFCGMCFAIAATNYQFFKICWGGGSGKNGDLYEQALASGTAFMQLMSAKEAFWRLTSEEIAGMAAATLADTVLRLDIPRVVETCGMGGDTGFRVGNTTMKTINVSTLSAIVLSSLGLPVMKHGSYANTSAVGSTDVVERFGAHTSMYSVAEAHGIRDASNFCYLDAHLCRTIHDLSHLLMMETINHIVGPMSAPVKAQTEINKVIGVNQKVHPSSVVQAYIILHERGVQNVGGVIALGGLREEGYGINPTDAEAFREYCILDEISPYVTVCSVAYQKHFLGNFLLYPEDFGIRVDPKAIKVANESDAIQKANITALRGENDVLADYLAMNAALGLFAERFVAKTDAVVNNQLNRLYLQACYRECRDAIASGRAWEKLVLYVNASGGTLSLE